MSKEEVSEKQIDEMACKLFDLTYYEVLLVDPDFWLSKVEYNHYKIE